MKKIIFTLNMLFGAIIYGQAPTNGLVAYYGFESNVDSHDSQNNFTAASNNSTAISYNSAKRGNGICNSFDR